MAAFNKVNQFVEDVAKGVHIFGTHTLKVALTNTVPVAATSSTLSTITQITGGTGYTTGGTTATTTGSTQSAGTFKLICSDVVFTATGSMGPFRYAVLYNDTPTSPADPVIGWYDYGSSVTLANTETFTVDFDGTNGVLTIA